MHPYRRLRPFGLIGSAVASAILAGTLVASPAVANPQGTNVIINEVYLKAGSANAVFNKKFVELYNPSDAPVTLENWSLQYRPATSTVAPVASGIAPLSGTVPAKGHFLIAMPGNGSPPLGAELPTPT
ncbi:lamin tail domain-containing protein [Leucobacter coleopterorum]|uniref:lamin tail domain-containing protein n=1 Tax=Leucobacter coleopterorum TaxID=2714933 RepID=UPI001FCAC8FC|nr:lamin tail domain-containing protein [Leucobacter coleopterorum]